MIQDARVLQDEFIPREIVHRHEQMNRLAAALEPVVEDGTPQDALLVGPSGAGKTCLARHSLDKLNEQLLDVDDLDLEGDRPNATGPGIKFVHRPDQGTPLKNKHKSERWNSISAGVARVLDDYISDQRVESYDEHGREPLISTKHGRMTHSSIRTKMYQVSRPCWYGDGCPHDREIETCEATEVGKRSRCPSARSPHDFRSGRLTYYRIKEVDKTVVSDRMDASEKVLDKHYDRRSERQKAEQRRSHLPDL